MENNGICVLSILPLILLIDQERYEEIAYKLRMGILSVKENESEGAIIGFYTWMHYSGNKKISPPPRDLLIEFVNKVATRRQPNLFSAIGTIAEIIGENPSILDNEQIRDLLLIAVEYLLKETELPSYQSQEKWDQYKSPIPLNELPRYRKISAVLAYNLFKYFESMKKPIPNILVNWKEVCQSEILPEVRRAWG